MNMNMNMNMGMNMMKLPSGITSGDPTAILNNQLASALSTMGDAQFWEETISPSTIRTSLSTSDPSNPNSTPELQKGMKWLLASISKGRDVSDFYPHVVKLVGVHNLEVRKMVYMYLVQYADHDATTRELSLLSINSFQRGLADSEQLIRALALRVLSSIRIADILQIQILGVQKCAKDLSPYVRKCAANALAKLSAWCDDMQKEMLLDIMKTMLHDDDSTMVLSSALIAFSEMCPRRLEILHPAYRKICRYLTDMDEWGQVVALDILARYCRTFFKEPKAWKGGVAEQIDRSRRVRRTSRGLCADSQAHSGSARKSASGGGSDLLPGLSNGDSSDSLSHLKSPQKIKRRVVIESFYSDEEDESGEEEVYAESPGGPAISTASAMRQRNILGLPGVPAIAMNMESAEDSELDEDHRLLLNSAMPLLKSRNSGVVLAVCSLLYYCGVSSVKARSVMGKALVRIHRDRREIQYVALTSIRSLVTECPSAFTPYLNDFFVKGLDPPFSRILKLDILTSLALEPAAIEAILDELRTYILHADQLFVKATIRSVGKVVELARIVYDRHGQKSGNPQKERESANGIALDCLNGLVAISRASTNPSIICEAITVMQNIIIMLHSDAGNSGMSATSSPIDDPSGVQSAAFGRIVLLLVYNLSRRQRAANLGANAATYDSSAENDDDCTDGDDGDNASGSVHLKEVAVKLPSESLASAIWIVGEWVNQSPASSISTIALQSMSKSRIRAELVRLLNPIFPHLEHVEKLQAIHFAAKIMASKYVNGDDPSATTRPLCEHLLAMGKADVDVDIRDRARFEYELVRGSVGFAHDMDESANIANGALGTTKAVSTEQFKRIVLARKPCPSYLKVQDDNSAHPTFRFGTLSSLMNHKARGAYLNLPNWAKANSPSDLRNPSESATVTSNPITQTHGMTAAPVQSTSDFYRDNAGSNESSSSDDSDSSSSSSSSSSSDDSDSDSDASSDSSSSSSNDDDSSDSDDDDSPVQGQGAGYDPFQTAVSGNIMSSAPPTATNGATLLDGFSPAPQQMGQPVPSLLNDDSSSDDSDSDSNSSSSSSSSDSDNGVMSGGIVQPGLSGAAPTNGTGMLISMGDSSGNATAKTVSSTMDDFKGLVMAPVTVDASQEINSAAEADCSAWVQLVRPEHCNGLAVQAKYLRGSTRTKALKLKGMDPSNPAIVCMEMLFVNKRTDSTSLRRIKVLNRASHSGSIATKRVVAPLEIVELKRGQQASASLCIEFAKPSNHDGDIAAKFEIRTSTTGFPIELKPSLGQLLLPCKLSSTQDFDKTFSRMHGLERAESRFEINPTVRAQVPMKIVKEVALTAVAPGLMFNSSNQLRLVGRLPASEENVYVLIECDPTTGRGNAVVCCDQAVVANTILSIVKRAVG